jgi:hypothetical protein
VGFVVDKAAVGQVLSEYFGFPANHHSTNFSIIIITRGWHNRPIGGRSAEWTQLDSIPQCTNSNFKKGQENKNGGLVGKKRAKKRMKRENIEN